jgi:hypothetical protein
MTRSLPATAVIFGITRMYGKPANIQMRYSLSRFVHINLEHMYPVLGKATDTQNTVIKFLF